MDALEGNSQDVQRKALRFPPLQTTFDNQAYQQLHRPGPPVNVPDEKPYGNMPHEEPYGLQNKHLSITTGTKTSNVKRRTSGFGLAGLFSRSKPSDTEGKQEKLNTKWEADESAERPATQDTEANLNQRVSFPEEIDALPPIESTASPLRHRASKPALRPKSSFKKEVTVKTPTTWDPPPLFQAYPQSVKYATLRAPSLSAEAILRLNTTKNASTKPSPDLYTPDSNPPKAQKERRLKRHTAAEVLSKGDWTHKIFILVTSGYFLQYAGGGSFDRFPEKIMPLTTESAAFASDAIPGQPYVLQVSQVLDDQGTLDKEASKSMLKKLGLRNEMRRSTSTFLLVLETPEEMSSWLVAVRKEIQAMGGKEYKPDEFRRQTTEQSIQHLQQRPSQRYLVKRDPNRFSEKPRHPHFGFSSTNGNDVDELSREAAETPVPANAKRQSLATERSMGSRSVSNATASINQVYLDRLRESPRRSYASTGTKTMSTSRGSSLRLSPDKLKAEIPDMSHDFSESRPTASTYPGAARSFMQASFIPNAKHRESLRPHPTASPPQHPPLYTSQHQRTPSPAAPNFSVPSFSERYSTADSSPALSTTTSKTQTPPITLLHKSPSPPIIEEEDGVTEKRTSTIAELQHLRKPSPIASRRISSPETEAFLTPPASSGSCDPPLSADGDRPYSHRFSSLEYSRGISPIQLASPSPSPHPPPTAALPALPGPNQLYRASLIPPPTTALPAIPSAGKLPARYSMMPPPTTTLPAVPVPRPSPRPPVPSPPSTALSIKPKDDHSSHIPFAPLTETSSTAAYGEGPPFQPSLIEESAQGWEKTGFMEEQKPRRPISTQFHDDTISDQPSLASPETGIQTAFETEGLTPPVDDSPPPPTREPPPPPPQQGHVQGRRSIPRIGREPPPVYSPVTSPRPRISVSSRAESYFDGAAPHPFIPPIRVSERKFRGSLDGPWNPSYGAPQRNFLDLSAG